MALDPNTLAAALEAAEVEASGAALSPEAAAKIKQKCAAQAAAIHAFILAGDVATVVTTTVAPGITIAGASPGGPVSGATTTPGAGSGAGTGKMT